MKKIFLAVVVLISLSLFSCTPSTPVTPSTNNVVIGPQPKFQCKVNGTLYICDAMFDSRRGWITNGGNGGYNENVYIGGELPGVYLVVDPNQYQLVGGISNSQIETWVVLPFVTSSAITTGTYNSNNLNAIDMGSYPFDALGTIYDYSTNTITFTRVSNGTADGTFSGTVWPSSNPTNIVNITEGVFSNVLVIQ